MGVKNLYNQLNFYVKKYGIKKTLSKCFRVLKRGKFCAILIGDTRKSGHMVPMGFPVMEIFQSTGFRLKELIIKWHLKEKYIKKQEE